MRTDQYGLILMEQTGFPGNVGDSCAETFRYALLKQFLGQPLPEEEVLKAISNTETTRGFLRHPTSPWRENDFSGDQWLPRFLAITPFKPFCAQMMIVRLGVDGYRTGNGDPIAPILYAAVKRFGNNNQPTFFDVALLIQVPLFLLPFRWSESRGWFESNKDSSADYLNWFIYLVHCEIHGHSLWSKLSKRWMNPKRLIEKVTQYYKVEPNAFVVPLYEQAVKRMWR